MIVTRRITKNGSSPSITLPRSYLAHVGWQMGKEIVLELLEDDTILLRIPTARDFRDRAAGPGLPVPPIATRV